MNEWRYQVYLLEFRPRVQMPISRENSIVQIIKQKLKNYYQNGPDTLWFSKVKLREGGLSSIIRFFSFWLLTPPVNSCYEK